MHKDNINKMNLFTVENSISSNNMQCAKEGLKYCEKKFPLGGTNRLDVQDKFVKYTYGIFSKSISWVYPKFKTQLNLISNYFFNISRSNIF